MTRRLLLSLILVAAATGRANAELMVIRDLDYFKLKILGIHQARYALVG